MRSCLIFFLLALSYKVEAQIIIPNPACSGAPINLRCSDYGPVAIYTWGEDNGLEAIGRNVTIYSDGSYTDDLGIHAGAPQFYHTGWYWVSIQTPLHLYSDSEPMSFLEPITISGIPASPSCHNGNNGSIAIDVTGGSYGGYTFKWSNGVITQNIYNLSAGTYTVTVTDDAYPNPCSQVSSPFVLDNPAAITIGKTGGSDVRCYGFNDGSIILSVGGGVTPYHYVWSPPGADSPNITGLSPNSYFVTVTDAHSCATAGGPWVISQPSDLTINLFKKDATCTGSNTGYINLTVRGGSSPYNYTWSNGAGNVSSVSGLAAGSYTVTVSYGTGCTTSSPPISVGTANQLPGPAGGITGQTVVIPGQTSATYSVEPIANATGYLWILPPGTIIVSGFNTASITIFFSNSATSGNISVSGVNICGNGLPSPDKYISVIQIDLVLRNISPGAGTSCYNAIQTIYVAGSGSTFIVNNGVSVTMIAGQNIIYLPGTTVYNEGYLHGYITSNGQYCSLFNPVVNNPIKVGEVQVPFPEIVDNKTICVYPNPTSCSFTIELRGTAESGMQKVDIYSMNGVKVLSETLTNEHKHIFTIDHLRPGVYFIHVMTGTFNETIKVIKL